MNEIMSDLISKTSQLLSRKFMLLQ